MGQIADRPGPDLIVTMFNTARSTAYTLNQAAIGTPTPLTGEVLNTSVPVTFTGGPFDGVTKVCWYNRIDFATMMAPWGLTFQDNGSFVNLSDFLPVINAQLGCEVTADDIVDGPVTFETLPATLSIDTNPASLLFLPSTFTFELTAPDLEPFDTMLRLDFASFQADTSPAYLSFIANIQDPLDYAYAYRITQNPTYATQACDLIDAELAAHALALANEEEPDISLNGYFQVGKKLTELAAVYAWCNPSPEQRAAWSEYADQVVYNIWNHTTAAWGETPAPWSGEGNAAPGTSRYFSLCLGAGAWALASSNVVQLAFLENDKLDALRNYLITINGGGSLEGTGYGEYFMYLFELYQFWKDSEQPELGNANEHLAETMRFFIHATMPTLDTYCPIGDMPRQPFPALFDYHRNLMLKARYVTIDTVAQSEASWWLNNISVTSMSVTGQYKYDLLPAGDNISVPPEPLVYRSEGPGCLFSRTSWSTNAVHVHFLAGAYQDTHAHQAQGSFSFFKDTFLTVTANIWSTSGTQQSVLSNNVLRFERADTSVIPQNFGEAVMSSTIGSTEAMNAQTLLADIMADATVVKWDRDMHFEDGIFTIDDDVETNSGTTATFQVCVPNEPTVTGNACTMGDLEVIVFYPPTPTFDLVEMSDVDPDFVSGWRIDIGGSTDGYNVQFRSVSHSGSGLGALAAPRFSEQPQSQTIVENSGPVTFEALAVGPGVISYIWEMRIGGVWDETGDTGTSTVLNASSLAYDGTMVRVTAVNANGSTLSRTARLTVTPA